ncbi:hypothetical protein DMA11_23290 [Marinilabiliaceae bacterium JC017]|nr:hypothetical protein DMA11_23290 [Marinilabiliaceae bacterium JC017]
MNMKSVDVVFFVTVYIVLCVSCKQNIRDKEKLKSTGELVSEEKHCNNNDTLNYVIKEFYDDGKVSRVIPYKDGEINGKVVYYHRNGNIKEIDSFKNGKLHGIVNVHNEFGNKIRRYLYLEGEQIVFQDIFYNPEHKLVKIENYNLLGDKPIKNGLLIQDFQGNVIKEKSLFYKIHLQDTISNNSSIRGVIFMYLSGCSGCYADVSIGTFNEDFSKVEDCYLRDCNITDSVNFRISIDEYSKGDNLLLGKMIIKNSEGDSITGFNIFKDFFVR